VGEHLGEHGFGAVGDRQLDRTRDESLTGEVGDRERAVGRTEVGTQDHPGLRVEREAAWGPSPGGGGGLHDDELMTHQLLEPLTQRRPAQPGDLDQLGARRRPPGPDVLQHLTRGGGREPRRAGSCSSAFDHGAH